MAKNRLMIFSSNSLQFKLFSSIHPFSIPASSVARVVGGLEPIPAVIGREAGYTLDRSPVHHRATRQTTTHTPRTILETLISLTCMFLDGGRKPEYPERNLRRRTCKLHTRKGPSRELNPLAVRRQC